MSKFKIGDKVKTLYETGTITNIITFGYIDYYCIIMDKNYCKCGCIRTKTLTTPEIGLI